MIPITTILGMFMIIGNRGKIMEKMSESMKKIIMALVLSLLVFGKAFACESIFDKIDGITCEIQYIVCKDNNINIKECDKVLEKVEQFEEAYENYKKANKTVAEFKREIEYLEKEHDVENKSKLNDMRFKYKELLYDAGRAFDEYANAINNFLGEEGLKLVESEEFCNEVWSVLEDHIDYNYLMD